MDSSKRKTTEKITNFDGLSNFAALKQNWTQKEKEYIQKSSPAYVSKLSSKTIVSTQSSNDNSKNYKKIVEINNNSTKPKENEHFSVIIFNIFSNNRTL